MSQSSRNDINIFTELSNTTADSKNLSTGTDQGTKRVAANPNESLVKQIMCHHHSEKGQDPSVVSKSCYKPKFVSAAEIFNNARKSIQMMPEITDEELLAMTIEFENKRPQ